MRRMESFFVQEGVVLSVMFGQIAGQLHCNIVVCHSLRKVFLFLAYVHFSCKKSGNCLSQFLYFEIADCQIQFI